MAVDISLVEFSNSFCLHRGHIAELGKALYSLPPVLGTRPRNEDKRQHFHISYRFALTQSVL